MLLKMDKANRNYNLIKSVLNVYDEDILNNVNPDNGIGNDNYLISIKRYSDWYEFSVINKHTLIGYRFWTQLLNNNQNLETVNKITTEFRKDLEGYLPIKKRKVQFKTFFDNLMKALNDIYK